jgi:ComF family protein
MRRSNLKFPALFRDASVSLLFPTFCGICGASVESVQDGKACQRCWQAAENARLNFDYCEKCDVSLPRLKLQSQRRCCGLCNEFAFTAARAVGNYTGAIRESVLRLKLQPEISTHLRKLLDETYRRLPNAANIEMILPVPLHPHRQKNRSYNQAEIIAQALSRQTGVPVMSAVLTRAKDTERHRAGMDAKARLQSLEGAFTVHAPRLIAYRAVLLVDDVMTTGSTAHEIARTLGESGARSVNVLTLARATTALH